MFMKDIEEFCYLIYIYVLFILLYIETCCGLFDRIDVALTLISSFLSKMKIFEIEAASILNNYQ
jgi:hypothetical protein